MTTAPQLWDVLVKKLGPGIEPWRGPFMSAPRELFVPDRALRVGDNLGPEATIDRREDKQAWLEGVYSDDIIVTHLDDSDRPASSCSMPYMVLNMLNHLDVPETASVLEVGTGTGWNAALLAGRVGAHRVRTVEIDPEIAAEARANLSRLSRPAPDVVEADGERGWPAAAPYDRLIATCTVHRVPPAWVEQVKPAGVVLTPWGTPLGDGALLRLRVDDDGRASGTFVGSSAFMWLRAQQFTAPDEPDDFDATAAQREARINVKTAFTDAIFALGVLVPACKLAYDRNDDGLIETFWLLATDSWASANAATGVVRQLGRRRLWDEMEFAYNWWTDAGRPGHERFGVTIEPGKQSLWLDDPSRSVTHGARLARLVSVRD